MQHSNAYIIRFALIICVACAGVLAVLAQSLKPLQDTQKQLFVTKNILKVLDLVPAEDASPREVLDMYEKNVERFFINIDGERIEAPKDADKFDALKEFKRFGLDYNSVNDLQALKQSAEYQRQPMRLSVFVRKDENGKPKYYAIPVFGKGLWSTIRAYVSFETDMNTIHDITFYEHNETPGLGARIEEPWFMTQFKSKKIYNESGTLVSVDVVKGGINPTNEMHRKHAVDGIAGATITANGVRDFLKTDFSLYQNFFPKFRAMKMDTMQQKLTLNSNGTE